MLARELRARRPFGGEHWLREHADIEDQLAWEFDLPAEAVAISVALDRVSVPMEEAAKRSAGRPRKGAPTRPVERNFRMAYCATITMHDAAGESLHTLRYGCMPASDHELWFAQIANEAHRLVEQRPGIRIKLLSDGAPEMCNLLQTNFPATVFSTVEQGIDFWHVIEKLAPAAEMLFGKDHCSDELRRWRKNSGAPTQPPRRSSLSCATPGCRTDTATQATRPRSHHLLREPSRPHALRAVLASRSPDR
ncbi:MAG: hypothetical protein H6837_16680 [Planctomycetes bacterium]|nr:hypothetical protein [Planctomycetota bacterium]